jgi:hypothetical protein
MSPITQATLEGLKNRPKYNGNDPNLTKDGRKRWGKPKKLTATDLLLANEQLNMETAAMLRLEGYAWEAIAETLGVSFNLLASWPKSIKYNEIYGKALEIYRNEQKVFLNSLIPKALQTMDDLMTNARSEHVKYEAAQAILTHAEIAKNEIEQSPATDHSTFLDNLRKKAERTVNNVAVQVNVGSFPPSERITKIVEGEYKEIV